MPQFLQTEATEPSFRPDSAWLEHGPFATWLVRKMRPRRFVELGTHWGYSYFAVCETVLQEGLSTNCTAVDTWQGDIHAGPYDETVFETVQRENGAYAGFSTLLRKTFDEALADIEDGSVDLLHIDGRHFYEDVQHDFETWISKLAEDAIVLFHDTEVRERGFGVYRLWADLAQNHPSFNFVHGHGLGVLFKGRSVPASLTEMVNLSAARGGPGVIEDYFQLFGGLLSERVQARQRYSELEGRISELELERVALGEKLAGTEDLMAQKLRRAEQERLNLLFTAEAEMLEVASAAQRVAAKAAKAERHPFRTLARRTGYGLVKGLLHVPAVERRLGPQLRKVVAKHGPNRYLAMLPSKAKTAPMHSVPLYSEPPHNAPLQITLPKARLTFIADSTTLDAASIATDLGRYALRTEGNGYTYIPLMPPPDLGDRIASLSRKPRFSVIMPTYNTPPVLLGRAIASLEAQWYPEWHLVIVDDCSPCTETQQALDALSDNRITLVRRPENGGISAATNTAIAHAEGDYVVFLDHDDELTPDCLWELALEIDRSDADFIYSDEDKIDENGSFVQPFFKPDWSPDALMNTMYTCHVSCVRTELAKVVGPLKSEYDGSQDWDFILRVTERAERIRHVPKVLYHWRIIPGSVAGTQDAKPKAIERSRILREDALVRRGLKGTIEALDILPSYFRPRYDANPSTRLSVIIPTRDNGHLLRTCIASVVSAQAWENVEFVVVDNGSSDPMTLEVMQGLPALADVKVVRHDHPFNYSELNNVGAAAANGEVLLYLNDDTELRTPDAISRMIGYALLPHVGAVGARLLYPGGTMVQHVGVLNLDRGPSHAFRHSPDHQIYDYLRNHLDYNWLAVTGAALMVERKKMEAIGGWDTEFPVAYNDVEFCFRLRKAGYHNVVSQASRFIHHESLSRGQDDTPAKKARLRMDWDGLYEKHPDFYMHDPYSNPNLQPNGIFFELPFGASA